MKKNKIFIFASLMLGLSFTACDDDDNYFISTDPVIDASSITTGSSDVTATTATLYGTVKGLDDMSAAFYKVGFKYGYEQNALSNTADGTLVKGEGRADGGTTITAALSGLPTGKTIYYQAFVTLKNQVTFTGEVSSLVTTDAKVTTADAQAVDFAGAVMGGQATDATPDATVGVVIATAPDVETVRAGLILPAASQEAAFTVAKSGLAPATKYYYAAYLDLGSGIVYGDVKEFTTAAADFDADNDFVDLGLSVKWAKSNLGAKSATDLGGLFGFGDATGVNNSFDPAQYASADIYKTKQDIVWLASDGVATLPSAADYEELFAKCKAEWTEVDGVAGYQLTGPNGNSIFLPAAGTRTANDVTGEGTVGYYATGSINVSDNTFADGFQFFSGNSTKISVPVYQALSVRAISTARNVPFEKAHLYTKWYLDNGQDGKQHVFEGPFTQWGDTDNWNTVTNNYPNLDQQIYWEMGKDNGWIGYTYGKDYGYMEFTEDGKVNIHRIAEDGTATDETGTYTIDETDKTIDIDINVLCANTWIGTKSGKLKILALDNDGLRIALPNGDGYAYSLNYYSERKREFDDATPVNFQWVDGNWSGCWGEIIDRIDATALDGKHTLTYNGSAASAMVVNIDFQNIVAKYPNVVIFINEIRTDGTSIKFDANDFFYGDIEDKGHYRIEMFNIWGKGAADGKIVKSPFSAATNVESDPAVSFTSKIEIDYTIITNPAAYTPGLVTIEPTQWGGDWTGPNDGSFTAIVDENNKLAPSKKEFDITLNAADYGVDYSAGSIMTFINTEDLMNVFPGTHMTLTDIAIDGTPLSGWDAAKVPNSSDGAKHRLELWNTYGVTGTGGYCAFGVPSDTAPAVVAELGFSTSMRVKFTVDGLFPAVEW